MNMRFGSVSMMAATAAAILGFNTLSLHVSAERAKVDRLERQIASDLRDIRALEAELRTRARLPVLQTWNDNVLAMSAPTAKQFADSPVQLAAFAPGAPAAAPGVPAVQMAIATQEASAVHTPGLVKASYEVPAAPALAGDMVIDLTGERVAVAGAVPAKPVETAKAEIRKPEPRKAETKPDVRKPDAAKASKPAETKPKAAPTRLAEAKPKAPKPVSKSDDGLDSLIGTIDSAAEAERSGVRKVAMR